MITEVQARRGEAARFTASAERLLELLWGADVERTVDVILVLGAHALDLGLSSLAARFVARARPAAHALAMREDHARLALLERLAEDALLLARGPLDVA